MEKETRCLICQEVMPQTICAYWDISSGKSMHIGCSEQEKTVYKIASVSAGGFYYDEDLNNIPDMVGECEIGDGYTITKEVMSAGKFATLPEFTGF